MMMATLPKSIQAQVEAADAMLASVNAPPAPPAQAQPVEVAEVAAPEPETHVEQAAPVPAPVPEETWEHKFKTLQGLFNKEVPQLQRQVKELSGRYQEAVSQLEKAAKPVEPPVKSAPDPRDVENFGEDMVAMVSRVTKLELGALAQKFDSLIATFDKRLASVETNLKGTSETVAYTAEQTFLNNLTRSVPNWEQINGDPAFHAWLSEEDPVLGSRRQTALTAAEQSLNAERVAAIFKAFGATRPVAPKSNPISKQVSPSAVASAQPVAQEKQILTQQQIVEFYNSVRRGEYRGREVERVQAEAEVNLAIAEGRVR
jgi:hypothetical protein